MLDLPLLLLHVQKEQVARKYMIVILPSVRFSETQHCVHGVWLYPRTFQSIRHNSGPERAS